MVTCLFDSIFKTYWTKNNKGNNDTVSPIKFKRRLHLRRNRIDNVPKKITSKIEKSFVML